jgi:hypothetical protein
MKGPSPQVSKRGPSTEISFRGVRKEGSLSSSGGYDAGDLGNLLLEVFFDPHL